MQTSLEALWLQSRKVLHNLDVRSGLNDTLGRLPHAEDAPFNSYTKQHEPACLPDTRVDLLNEIHSWADGQDERCIFWLSGLAGTGKSTIARTVARRYHDRQRLAASFFFSRGGGDVGHAGKFVTSVAVQFAQSVPAVRQHISDAVAERSDIVSQSLRDQWQHLVCRPLSMLHEPEARPETYIVVVDALDECNSDSNIRIIVRLLAEDSGTDEHFEILPEQRLDSIYLTVLKSPIRRYRKQERKRWYTLIRETLGAIVLLQSPLSASSLARLLRVPAEDVHRTLYELHSVVDVP
ncbi:hypothetical protein BU25DRAFT_454382 [Macroventuria anomochaeta]|uniref:Uncharacterized protein n=1 Tax=Macroventuria anomochaeta TaxID=301207 RepID=A0ACB6SDG5_9PLEO|nr:uncharacterized protein BU25DRAFT_454382 [Macroventuria anomochaeta]KAF2632008.1 hypothetical protein BU25DRAFT_454382 [Macroventuria anomochaeta]